MCVRVCVCVHVCEGGGEMHVYCKARHMYYMNMTRVLLTLNRKSVERHGSWKAFLARFPAVKLVTFKQSKNLSIIWTNLAVSVTSGFPVSKRAFATELLRTYIEM